MTKTRSTRYRQAHRQRRHAEVKTLPIRFHAVEPGIYESTLETFNGPWACTYRIHKTKHHGRGTSHSGRTRWHTIHVLTGQLIGHAHDHNKYALTLDGAIHTLHQLIGRGLINGFEVLAKMNAEAQQERASERAAMVARSVLEQKINAVINTWKEEPSNNNNYDLLIKLIADTVQS